MSTPSPALRTSPFRMKGTVYRGSRLYLDAKGPEHWSRFLEALSPTLREFMQQRFLSAASYEALVLPDVLAAEAKVVGMGRAAHLRDRARWQAEHELSTLYRVVIRLAPREVTMQRLVQLMTQVWIFPRTEWVERRPGLFHVRFHGVPAPLTPVIVPTTVTYAEYALGLAGGRDDGVEVKGERVGPDRRVEGVATEILGFQGRWRPRR